MTDGQNTDQSLDAIYGKAITLAADRLGQMNAHQTDEEFDRGARSVGTLVRTAMQVDALKSQIEKDRATDDAKADLTLPSEDEIEEFKATIMAQLERDEEAETKTPDNERDDQEPECGGCDA